MLIAKIEEVLLVVVFVDICVCVFEKTENDEAEEVVFEVDTGIG